MQKTEMMAIDRKAFFVNQINCYNDIKKQITMAFRDIHQSYIRKKNN